MKKAKNIKLTSAIFSWLFLLSFFAVLKYEIIGQIRPMAVVSASALSTEKPDLIVEDIAVEPLGPTVKDRICIYATIKNIGFEDIASGDLTAWTYVNDAHISNTFYGRTLGANERIKKQVLCSKYGENLSFKEGSNLVRVVIDPAAVNIVDEKTETNNEKTANFTISKSLIASKWSEHGSYTDYNKMKLVSFSSNRDADMSKTTADWSEGKVALRPAPGATDDFSYEVVDRSSVLNNFKGPVTTFSNDNILPIIGSKNLSLNLPMALVKNLKGQDISDRLVNFSGAEVKAMSLAYYGDVFNFVQEINKDLDENATIAQVGNNDAHVYLLVGGDNSSKGQSTSIVRLNKLKAVTFTSEGVINIETDDLSSEISKLGFETISDISCSEKECLIIGAKGKLASYDGKIFTDLSGKIGFNTSEDSKIGWSGDYWIIAGTIYSPQSIKYVGTIYKYQNLAMEKITADDMFVSSKAGVFNMSLNNYWDKWLIIKAGDPIKAYVYDGDKFSDLSSKIGGFYSSSESFLPDVHRSGKAWFIINKGAVGHILRFDGENIVDVKDALNIKDPLYVIGSADLYDEYGSALLLGGGTESAPKLYEITESSSTKPSSYSAISEVQSIKMNSNTGNVMNTYLAAVHKIPAGTSIKYYISNNGGKNWEEISIGQDGASMKLTFASTGNDLRWKAVLATNDKKISPEINHLSIYYSEEVTAGTNLKDGDLMRTENDPRVFVIVLGKKKWIKNGEEFMQKGYSWSDVKVVTAETLNGYSDYIEIGKRTDILKPKDQDRVYRIINGKSLWIPSAQAFNAQGLRWDEVRDVSSSELEKYPQIKLIKAKGDEKIFYVTNSGMKKHIPNPEVFSSYNNKWEDVVEVDREVTDSLPTVNLIKDEKGMNVYKVEGTTKRLIRSQEAFNRNKFDWDEIAPVNDVELNFFSDGEVIE